MNFLWLGEPILLFVASFAATQLGTTFAKEILKRHAENPNRHSSYPTDLRDAIKNRDEHLRQPGGKTLDSYLNQIIATWGLVLLITGQSLVMWIYRPDMVRVAGWTLFITMGLIIAVTTWNLLGQESLMPYYDKNTSGTPASSGASAGEPTTKSDRRTWVQSKVPPMNTLLTWLRIVFMIIYVFLLIASYRPNQPKMATEQSTPPRSAGEASSSR